MSSVERVTHTPGTASGCIEAYFSLGPTAGVAWEANVPAWSATADANFVAVAAESKENVRRGAVVIVGSFPQRGAPQNSTPPERAILRSEGRKRRTAYRILAKTCELGARR